MEALVIFGSHYGTAKRYAEELARKLGAEAVDYRKVGNIPKDKAVVYIGSLYAGGVVGLSKTIKKQNAGHVGMLVIATVGLADPENENNIQHIRESLKKQLPIPVYQEAKIFHLRGGIDYKRMNIKHKIMMKALYSQCKRMPEGKQDEETKCFLETYGGTVDYVDFDKLDKICQVLKD